VDGQVKWTLAARPPFSLRSVIRSHGWIDLRPFAQRDDALAYVARLDGGRVCEILVRQAENGVAVEAAGDLDAGAQAEVTGMVRWMLALDRDLSPFYARARGEPHLRAVEAQAKGRLLRSPTLFEDVVKTILTTNTTWSGTVRMVESLVQGYGDPLPGDPDRRAFPTPARLASASIEALRAAGLGYRSRYVFQLANEVVSGERDLAALRCSDLRTDEVRRRLRSIVGVGDYAAASLLMLLGRYDFIPVDSWALKLVSNEWHGGAPVGRDEVEAAFAQWGRWKGLAYWFWEWSAPQ
jgi:3-methyladenine DNA glycosylase/8-oxoguanine DNA glycosylase